MKKVREFWRFDWELWGSDRAKQLPPKRCEEKIEDERGRQYG
jgi:hypothetical protein